MEINVLETIERGLIEKYSEKGDIILMGDFNARTGSEEDLIISDDTSHVPLSDNQYVIDTAVGKRSSHDSHIDTRGKELLDMCISNQLRILNGRTFGDSFGDYACYKSAGCIVVDYAIVSQHLLCQIFYLQISFIFNIWVQKSLCKIFRRFLMSKYPHDPILRGLYFKINKEYTKLRKYKKKQIRQQIRDKLDTFQSNNQKEFWNLINSLRE
jgi:hypothetical protein